MQLNHQRNTNSSEGQNCLKLVFSVCNYLECACKRISISELYSKEPYTCITENMYYNVYNSVVHNMKEKL